MTDADFRAAADAAYDELLERTGEGAPRPRLQATRSAVELLGDPHRAYPIIHITGTNGKTSTSRIAESILTAYGLKTGLLTSPHLERVNERIVIGGEPISDEAFAANWADIRPYLEMVDARLIEAGDVRLTFFEALTVLAFASFADAAVDVAVIEVGMGGEWDSTNVADGQVAVFTPISLDHTRQLGSTVAEIARTKSGIVKPAATVVTAEQPAEAMAELRRAAELTESEFRAQGDAFALESTSVAVGGQLIDVRGIAGRYTDLFLPLYGDHQAQNAAVAIAAVESFLGGGTIPLTASLVEEGLAGATSPGRLQLIGVEPTVLVDAAHNPSGAESLAQAIGTYFDFDEVALVLGVLADKDAAGIIDALGSVAARIETTQATSPRALPADDLATLVRSRVSGIPVEAHESFGDAIETARDWAAAGQKRAVVVAGSILLVGEAMTLGADEDWKPAG